MQIRTFYRTSAQFARSAAALIAVGSGLAAVSCSSKSSTAMNPAEAAGTGVTSGTGIGPAAGATALPTGTAGRGTAGMSAARSGSGGATTTGAAGASHAAGAAAVSGKGTAGVTGTSGSSAAGTSAGSAGATASTGDCTRDALKADVDAYYTAMAAHDPSTLSTAMTVKFTENGKTMQLGDGMWKMAGMVKFKRSALDTTSCNSVTESVVPEGTTDRIFGLRLKRESQQITEVETIVVRQGDYILNNPSALAATSKDDWETVLPADQQATRDQLMMLMNTYFTKFPAGACNFASDCVRLEDGGSVGGCTGSGITCAMTAMTNAGSSGGMAAGGGMKPRLFVLDVDAGISVGFTMFAGTYTDFHLFKVRMGEVHGVHAVLASATSSGWD